MLAHFSGSITSILMFFSILASRYTEEDNCMLASSPFLFSVASMMVAFVARPFSHLFLIVAVPKIFSWVFLLFLISILLIISACYLNIFRLSSVWFLQLHCVVKGVFGNFLFSNGCCILELKTFDTTGLPDMNTIQINRFGS